MVYNETLNRQLCYRLNSHSTTTNLAQKTFLHGQGPHSSHQETTFANNNNNQTLQTKPRQVQTASKITIVTSKKNQSKVNSPEEKSDGETPQTGSYQTDTNSTKNAEKNIQFSPIFYVHNRKLSKIDTSSTVSSHRSHSSQTLTNRNTVSNDFPQNAIHTVPSPPKSTELIAGVSSVAEVKFPGSVRTANSLSGSKSASVDLGGKSITLNLKILSPPTTTLNNTNSNNTTTPSVTPISGTSDVFKSPTSPSDPGAVVLQNDGNNVKTPQILDVPSVNEMIGANISTSEMIIDRDKLLRATSMEETRLSSLSINLEANLSARSYNSGTFDFGSNANKSLQDAAASSSALSVNLDDSKVVDSEFHYTPQMYTMDSRSNNNPNFGSYHHSPKNSLSGYGIESPVFNISNNGNEVASNDQFQRRNGIYHRSSQFAEKNETMNGNINNNNNNNNKDNQSGNNIYLAAPNMKLNYSTTKSNSIISMSQTNDNDSCVDVSAENDILNVVSGNENNSALFQQLPQITEEETSGTSFG